MPTISVRGFSAITTIQAAKVPRPPSTAVSGTSKPKARKFSGGFQVRSTSACLRRSWITATWAIVNESIAPNEYIVARKSVLPGSRVTIAIAAKIRIAM